MGAKRVGLISFGKIKTRQFAKNIMEFVGLNVVNLDAESVTASISISC